VSGPVRNPLDQAEERITIAAVSAFLLAAVTATATGSVLIPFNWGSVTDVLIIIALGVGIAKRSRICAALLIADFLLSRYEMWHLTKNLQATVSSMSFAALCAFGMGLRGTVRYHRAQDRQLEPEGASPVGSPREAVGEASDHPQRSRL
jgi:hypothetical protein